MLKFLKKKHHENNDDNIQSSKVDSQKENQIPHRPKNYNVKVKFILTAGVIMIKGQSRKYSLWNKRYESSRFFRKFRKWN